MFGQQSLLCLSLSDHQTYFPICTGPNKDTITVQNVVQMELAQHHSFFEVAHTLPLVFSLVLYCKEEVDHLNLLIQHCMGDTVHIVVGGCMDSIAGRAVEHVPGTGRVSYFVLHILR